MFGGPVCQAKYWWQKRNVEMALHHRVDLYWTKQNVSFWIGYADSRLHFLLRLSDIRVRFAVVELAILKATNLCHHV